MYLRKLEQTLSFYISIIILFVNSFIFCKTSSEEIDLTFPDDFLIGVASSSYQVEGAWNVDGKGENVWDHLVHNYPANIVDRSTGDVACDFYHKYKQDIKLVKNLGFNHFRFSISWSRIFPNGFATKPNPKGVRFYHNILDELEKQGIIPVVTIYHWDHPQNFEKFGSWTNSYMAYVFADYARFIFQEYGARVKLFITINEPQIFCLHGYSMNDFAPGKNLSDWGLYMCGHNMLKAHALAYHIYDEEFRAEQGGKVGILLPCFYYYPKNKGDNETRDIAFEFNCGWIAHPIFSKNGDYPEIMKRRIAESSKLKGLTRSELPTFSKNWIELIKGSSDFFGLNHYTSYLVEQLPKSRELNWPNIEGIVYSNNSKWQNTQASWLQVVPEGFGDLLRKIKLEYDNPEVYVLECGVPDAGGINDFLRMKYLYSYMKEMLIAINRDECNVKAFTVWSLLDSFEWSSGYTYQFGLVQVDFHNKNLPRKLKKSTSWLKTVTKTRRLQRPGQKHR